MKKSTFWIIVAAISIIFAANAALSCEIITAMTGITLGCASLVVGAWYERKEKGIE